MNLLRKVFSSAPKEELAALPSGQFYLTRSPSSPKGVSECIFRDALAMIRRTSTDFHYQLVIQRVYEEGEEDLDEASSPDTSGDLDEVLNDEWTFLIDAELQPSYYSRDGHVVVNWRDLNGEPGDSFEFICDKNIPARVFDQFDLVCRRCQYERKYGKVFSGSDQLLDEFDFEPPAVVEAASSAKAPKSPEKSVEKTPAKAPSTPAKSQASVKPPLSKPNPPVTPAETKTPAKSATPAAAPVTPQVSQPKTPLAVEAKQGTVISTHSASLHLFDASESLFVEQAPQAEVALSELAPFEYWMTVTTSTGKTLLGMDIDPAMNPVFNFEHQSFIFNYFNNATVFSWLLRFKSFDALSEFQQDFMRALWEGRNRTKWSVVPETEKEYLIDSFGQMDLEEAEENEDDEDEDEEEDEPVAPAGSGFDADEYYDEEAQFRGEGKNSHLAVGYKNDRSYVVRGDKIGVFKHSDSDLEYATTIDNVAGLDGVRFAPSKVMLHTGDRTLVLQDNLNKDKLFSMDLEYGKVVDEWKVGDIAVEAVAPTSKFAQMTDEQTLVGLGTKSLFRIDPRLAGSKLVDSELKQYATKGKASNFSAISTTDKGHLAVAALDGSIRLYDRLGINAKTQLPAMGDPIVGLEVAADGKWVLATCATYLLLIDTTIKEGKNEGQIGFLKSFGKDSKPRPKRLQISPEHVAFMQAETGKPLNFTRAKFNAGLDSKEQTIVTSSGPYVITWSLRKVLRGDKEPYLIKRYGSEVTADDFKFGSDRNVIVSLENDVGMVHRNTFRKPTRESLATPARRIQAMSRNSVVNSPF